MKSFSWLLLLFLMTGFSHLCSSALECTSEESSHKLAHMIGSKIIVGFHGTSKEDPDVMQLMRYAQQGLIGGVILFSYNIVSQEQLKALITSLQGVSKYPLFITIDQEGGRVQRLRANNGFTDYLAPFDVARTMKSTEAQDYYEGMAAELRNVGINVTFGPVVDLHSSENHPAPNPVIGALKRSFGSDCATVIAYAEAFIKGHKKQGVVTCLKHYPGHGLASFDSHKGLVDITHTHEHQERLPYSAILGNGFEGMVMVAHLMHRAIDSTYPATLSENIVKNWLRGEAAFEGVIVSDDLHMGAIQSEFGFEDAVIQSINAGIDLLIFSNNPAANKTDLPFSPDSSLPQRVIAVVEQAVQNGLIKMSLIEESSLRIEQLRKRIRGHLYDSSESAEGY